MKSISLLMNFIFSTQDVPNCLFSNQGHFFTEPLDHKLDMLCPFLKNITALISPSPPKSLENGRNFIRMGKFHH